MVHIHLIFLVRTWPWQPQPEGSQSLVAYLLNECSPKLEC